MKFILVRGIIFLEFFKPARLSLKSFENGP